MQASTAPAPPPTLEQIHDAVAGRVGPWWSEMRAPLESVTRERAQSIFCLSFYRWHLTLKLEDYGSGGGVLLTASRSRRSRIAKAISAVTNPGTGGVHPVMRHIIFDATDVREALARSHVAVVRDSEIAPYLARRWRERGPRIGV